MSGADWRQQQELEEEQQFLEQSKQNDQCTHGHFTGEQHGIRKSSEKESKVTSSFDRSFWCW